MAETIISQSMELSVQLLSEDGEFSKLIKVPNPKPADSLGGYSGITTALKPLIADYQYTENGSTNARKGIFAEYKSDALVHYTRFGRIQIVVKDTTSFVP